MELTSTGLEIDTLSEILTGFEQYELANIATTLDLTAPDPIAVLNGVVADRLSSLEELAGAMYSGMQPDNATGDQLQGLALLEGDARQPATKTLVLCDITVDAAFTALAGTMFASVDGVPNLLYTNVNDFSAGGAGVVPDVQFACVDTGANVVNSNTLTVIAVALAHWTTINNNDAGVTGHPIQTDGELRLSMRAELSAGGSTNAAAIAADIFQFIQPSQSPLTIPGIATGGAVNQSPFTITAPTLSVTVLVNVSDVTDANGLPPHSFEAIVYIGGATDVEGTNALCALLLADKAAGIATYSGDGTNKVIEDDQGYSEAVYYTRPTALPTDIAVTVLARAGFTVTTGEVKDAIFAYVYGTDAAGTALVGYAPHWTPGTTAYQSSIVGAIFAFDIPGVANVTAVTLSAANVGNDIVPTVRQVVTVAAGDIAVTIL